MRNPQKQLMLSQFLQYFVVPSWLKVLIRNFYIALCRVAQFSQLSKCLYESCFYERFDFLERFLDTVNLRKLLGKILQSIPINYTLLMWQASAWGLRPCFGLSKKWFLICSTPKSKESPPSKTAFSLFPKNTKIRYVPQETDPLPCQNFYSRVILTRLSAQSSSISGRIFDQFMNPNGSDYRPIKEHSV